jgi:hypothetical protein
MRSTPNIPKVAPDLVWRLLDDNAVVVSPRAGEVRVLNRVGTIIWQRLIEENSPDDIEEYLVTHFKVTRRHAKSDLQVFIKDLTERGVLIWETGEAQ